LTMSPDQEAQIKQLRVHAKPLRVDIECLRYASPDYDADVALNMLNALVEAAIEAIEKKGPYIVGR
jgi:hypothetical protein